MYERADDWRKLISLNDERFALAVDDGERLETLRESAALWLERQRAVKAFESIVEHGSWIPTVLNCVNSSRNLVRRPSTRDNLAQAYKRLFREQNRGNYQAGACCGTRYRSRQEAR